MSKKERIPAAVRNTVWLKYVPDKNDARCYCCKLEKITTANWHCGHITSEKNGGKVHINNLRPICAGCNCSMGRMNMLDFMKKYGFGEFDKDSKKTPKKALNARTKSKNKIPKCPEKKTYDCNHCKRKFDTGAALGGHSIHCKKNPSVKKRKKEEAKTRREKDKYCKTLKEAILQISKDYKPRNYKEYFEEIEKKRLFETTDNLKNRIKTTLQNMHYDYHVSGYKKNSFEKRTEFLWQNPSESPYKYWLMKKKDYEIYDKIFEQSQNWEKFQEENEKLIKQIRKYKKQKAKILREAKKAWNQWDKEVHAYNRWMKLEDEEEKKTIKFTDLCKGATGGLRNPD